jgi:hypothetical protein
MASLDVDVTTLSHEEGTISVTFNKVSVGTFSLDAFVEQADGSRRIAFNFPEIVSVKRDYTDEPVPYDGITIVLRADEWADLIA